MNLKQKSLVALAVSSLLGAGVASAVDLVDESDPRSFSNEFLLATGDAAVEADLLAIVLGAEYTTDDVITLSFSGGALDSTTLPPSITVAADGGAELKGITLGLLSADESEAVYRVTALDGPAQDTTVGLVVPVGAANSLEFDTAAVQAAGGVTVSFSAATSTGLALDTGGGAARSFDLITVIDQFVGELTAADRFNGVIDVEEGRLQFVDRGGDRGTNVDIVSPSITAAAVDVDADVDGVTYTMSGDFSWITDTTAAVPGIQPGVGVVTVTGGCTIDAVTAAAVTWECPTLVASSLSIDVDANATAGAGLTPPVARPVLSPGPYTLTAAVDYSVGGPGGSDGTSTVLDGVNAGRWGLNGAQVVLPYMPFGAGISNVIYVANNGAQTGEISADVIDENTGEVTQLGVIGTVPARSTLSIGPALRLALPSNLRDFSRTSITITVNAPSDDIEVYGMYRVGDDRTTVPSVKTSD